jgi:hypothetical protein
MIYMSSNNDGHPVHKICETSNVLLELCENHNTFKYKILKIYKM